MSDHLLEFTRDSTLGKHVNSQPQVVPKPKTYNYLPSVPLNPTLLGIYDMNTNADNLKVQKFKLPRFGVLDTIWVELQMQATAADQWCNVPFLAFTDRLEIRSKDRVIATAYPSQILEYIKDITNGAKFQLDGYDGFALNAYNLATMPANEQFTSICPIPFSICGREDVMFDLRWVEDLELHWFPWTEAIFSSSEIKDRIYNGTPGNITTILANFYVQYYTDHKTLTFNKFLNYGTRLLWDAYQEPRLSFTAPSAVATIESRYMDITCPYPIWKISFLMEAVVAAEANPGQGGRVYTSTYDTSQIDFSSIEILDGTQIVYKATINQLRFEMIRRQAGPTTAESGTDPQAVNLNDSKMYIVTMYFNKFGTEVGTDMPGRMDYVQSQGGYNLTGFFVPSMFSNPRVKFNLISRSLPGESNFYMRTIAYYHKFYSLDAKTGKVTTEIKL